MDLAAGLYPGDAEIGSAMRRIAQGTPTKKQTPAKRKLLRTGLPHRANAAMSDLPELYQNSRADNVLCLSFAREQMYPPRDISQICHKN